MTAPCPSRIRAGARIALIAAALNGAALAAPAAGAPIDVEARLSQRVLEAGRSGKVYLQLRLGAKAIAHGERRTPVNVALVLDRSGSMSGARIAAAKEAARMAIDRLAGEDVLALVTYNHGVDVLQPAGRLTSHSDVKARVGQLVAGGRTALFAGVEEGARQVRRHFSPHRVNRVILLSDGLANVGPSRPAELAELGRRLAADGISVTTIGLGLDYNEDLMQRLAAASDGNHAFVEKPEKLVDIFNAEFGDVLSVAAQDVIITIECKPGFVPRRVLGREAKVEGQRITLRLGQLYGGQHKSVTIEVDTPADKADATTADIASVSVDYLDLASKSRQNGRAEARGRWSASAAEAKASIDATVDAEVTTQIATERNEEALRLRDKGDMATAQRLLQQNAMMLGAKAKELATGVLPAPSAVLKLLEKSARHNAEAAEGLDGAKWDKTRKSMRYDQHRNKVQQSY